VPAVLVQVDVNARDEAIASDANARELKIAVPCWMLDELACSAVLVQKTPALQIEALLRLRILVDQLASAVSERKPESHGNNAKGGRHAEDNSAAHQKAASQTTDARF
jgi:hypothetical protein